MTVVKQTLLILLIASMGLGPEALAQKTEPLWPTGKVPLSQGTAEEDTPTITPYVVKGQGGLAVVVFPGGGYRNVAIDHEGHQIAQWLNNRGVSAFVVRYRVGPKYMHPVMITDGQRAVRLVRSKAAEYGIRPDRIGVWGFSAGGHMASTISTHFEEDTAPTDDPTKGTSTRPDFAVLAYPVVSSDPTVYHGGSYKMLLGEKPDPKLLESFSNDKQVTAKTPPTFLFHTTDDKAVPVANALLYYQALVKHGVSAEMHIYQNGRHGVGLAKDNPILNTWADRLHDWLVQFGVKAR